MTTFESKIHNFLEDAFKIGHLEISTFSRNCGFKVTFSSFSAPPARTKQGQTSPSQKTLLFCSFKLTNPLRKPLLLSRKLTIFLKMHSNWAISRFEQIQEIAASKSHSWVFLVHPLGRNRVKHLQVQKSCFFVVLSSPFLWENRCFWVKFSHFSWIYVQNRPNQDFDKLKKLRLQS